MKIGPVSFGKIVKVNAPYEIAFQIENIVNKKAPAGSILKREVNTLFNDISKGDAHTFCIDNRTSYIFSGEEGKKYIELRKSAVDELVKAKSEVQDKEKSDEIFQKAWEFHRENIMELINNAGISRTIDPSYNKKMKVTSLNLYV